MPSPSIELVKWSETVRDMRVEDIVLPSIPFHVLLGEAVDVAKFHEKRWKTQVDDKNNVVLLGLDSVAKKSKRNKGSERDISAKTGDEIFSLHRAAHEAHSYHLLATKPVSDVDPMDRGRFLVGEMARTIEWYLDDGVEDEHDVKLARVKAAHANDPETADALALALNDYAALAQEYRDDIDGAGGFSASYIDEAMDLAIVLREKPERSVELNDPLVLRNKLITLLMQKMNAVRAAARFVYRDRPEIVREATSTYERRRRSVSRQAKKKGEPAVPPPQTDSIPPAW